MIRSYERLAAAPLAVMLTVAAGLFVYGSTSPVHTDHELFRTLRLNACDANGVVDGWYEQMAANETLRYPFMQSGVSLALAALTIFVIICLFSDDSRQRLVTPSRKWVYFALGIGVIGLSWVSQIFSLVKDLDRGIFAQCADTIIIPAQAITIFYLGLSVLCLVVGAALTFGFGRLPAALLAWRKDRLWVSVIVSLPFACIGGLIAFLGVAGAASSAFLGTPAAIVALYLTEATRSALLAPASSAREVE